MINWKKYYGTRKAKRDARKALALAKLGGKCVGCGSTEDLQFDHIDPETKLHSISTIIEDSRLEEELKKCQILCQPCHNEKTASENGYDIGKHGSSRYKSGCRCSICRAANNEYSKRYRQRQLSARSSIG